MDDITLTQHVVQNAITDSDTQKLKLTCDRGHQLAAELGVDIRRIGDVCQVEKIKIVHCQLGCFGEHHKH
jgi:hypothetical protein